MRSLLALLTFFFMAGSSVGANDPAITLWTGAGGYIRNDCIAPVFVVLDNDETQRDGYVSVRFSSLGATMAEARRDIELPPNSRKGVFLYVPNMGRSPDQVTVTYHNARGRRVNSIEERLRTVDPWLPVVAAVGALPTGLPDHASENGNALYTRLILQADHLPNNGIGLEMFDALIISPPPTLGLRREQVAALHDWTMRGGTLVVDVSERTDAYGPGPLASLLPLVPERIASLAVTELGTTETITEGSIHHGASTLFKSDSRPLVVRRNYGLGSITAFAISPDARGMKQWDGRAALWNDILAGLHIQQAPDLASQMEQPEEQRRTMLMNSVRTEQQTGLRLGLVLLLTLLYALVVGPGDYFFIKWLGKPKMTWVTFPAIVVVFTVAAWWGAKAWVGGDMASMHVRRTIVFPELGTATQLDLMGLFVPAGRQYAVRHQDGAHIQQLRSTLDTGETGSYDVDEATLEQRIPIWKSRVYSATWEPESYPQVDLLVELGEGADVVVVSNQTNRLLRGNSIVHGASVWRMREDIGPGEKVEMTLDQAAARPRAAITTGSQVLFGFGAADHEHWAYWRQLDVRDALRRGAYVFVSDSTSVSTNPLIVDGEQRSEPGRELLQIVTYPRSAQ